MVAAIERSSELSGVAVANRIFEVDTLHVNIGSDFEIVAVSVAPAVHVVGEGLQIGGSLD